MRVLIINLKRNPERRKFMQDQVAKLKLEYEFIEAIDGQNLDQQWQDKATSSLFYKQVTGNVGFASINEVACFASHYCCWQRCLELGQSVIVLEDDVVLSSNFDKSLAYLEALVKRLNYIRLMVLERHRAKRIISQNLYLYTDFPCGTQGYVITPFAATRFIRYSKKFYSPVDMYMDRWYLHGLRAYCVNPELISEEVAASSIGNRPKVYLSKPQGLVKLIRELVRPFQKLRMKIVGAINPIVKEVDLPPYNSI